MPTSLTNPQLGGAFSPSSQADFTSGVTFGSSVRAYASTTLGGGLGYATGAGGSVTQATSKSTGVTCNAYCGTITMNDASLNDATSVAFTLTNSAIAATDLIVLNIRSGATSGGYLYGVQSVSAGSCSIVIRNVSGGALGEALVLGFLVIKGVAA